MKEMHPSIEQIVDYLHGELSAAEDAAMHAHLSGCPQCDERRAQEVALTEMLRAHARATQRELPPRVVAAIRNGVRRSRSESAGERLRVALRPIFVLPAAAAAALAIYAGIAFWHPSAPTPIGTAYYADQHASLSRIDPFADDAPPATLTSDQDAR